MGGCWLPELMDLTPFLPMVNLKELDLGNNFIQVSTKNRSANKNVEIFLKSWHWLIYLLTVTVQGQIFLAVFDHQRPFYDP